MGTGKIGVWGIFCFLLVSSAWAQQQLWASPVNLALKRGDTVLLKALSKAAFSVRQGALGFKASIELFPIVPSPDAVDSARNQVRPLILRLEGKFPVTDMDFLTTTTNNGNDYTMPVMASLNDSTQKITVHFSLLVSGSDPIDPNGNFPKYVPRLNMVFILDPFSLGLNNAPYNMYDLLLVEARNAVINKLP